MHQTVRDIVAKVRSRLVWGLSSSGTENLHKARGPYLPS
jgi:hypothetical protein